MIFGILNRMMWLKVSDKYQQASSELDSHNKEPNVAKTFNKTL